MIESRNSMPVVGATATYHKLANGTEVKIGGSKSKLVCAVHVDGNFFHLRPPNGSTWKKATVSHGGRVFGRLNANQKEELQQRLALPAAVAGLKSKERSFLEDVLLRVISSDWIPAVPNGREAPSVLGQVRAGGPHTDPLRALSCSAMASPMAPAPRATA